MPDDDDDKTKVAGGIHGNAPQDTEPEKKDKWITDLIRINADQRASIDRLVQRLDSLSLGSQVVNLPVGVHGGVGATSMAVGTPALQPATPVVTCTTGHTGQTPVTAGPLY